MTKMIVEYRRLDDLKPRANNPRTHSKRQLEQIAASISRFGFTNPLLIDDDDVLIAGHGRAQAARMVGMTEVPVIRRSGMNDADVRAYVITDNRLAEKAGWDDELLRIEMSYLSELDEDFDLTLTGFELPEIDALLSEGKKPNKRDKLDEIPRLRDTPPVTRPGDIWQIGKHRLLCGSALDVKACDQLMGSEKAQMIFTDPPYNVPINGHVSGSGKHKHPEFQMASGEMSKDEFRAFLAQALAIMARGAVLGSIHFVCIDWRHLDDLQAAGSVTYHELKNICVWAKTNGGMGSLYRSAHELVLVFKYGTAPHINNVELGKHGRYRTNVWTYPGANSFSSSRDTDLAMHPTVKPVALVTDAIRDCSRPNDIILDGFAGAGTTLVAAQKTKRRGFGIEIDPGYCDLIIQRFRQLFDISATLTESGLPFDEVAAERTVSDREIAA